MSSEERRRHRDELFEALLDLAPDEVGSRLGAVAMDDAALGLELEELLAIDRRDAAAALDAPAWIPEPPVSTLQPGEPLGRYLVERLIGSGGMGAVYLAHDPVVDRRVAIKVLTAAPDDSDWRARFEAELKLLGKVRHDHVVGVHDFGETPDGLLYFVMEYLEGEDLATAIANGRISDVDQKLQIAEQIAFALRDLHGAGIVHRDVKPANVVLERSGRVKLIDFGIAKSHVGERPATKALGTPEYMSPERIGAALVSPADDMYAYGLLLFELFTGRRAVSGPIDRVVDQILHHQLPVDAMRGLAPGRVIDIVSKATSKNSFERPRNFDDILERLANGDRQRGKRARTLVTAATVIGIAAALAAAWIGSQRWGQTEKVPSVAVLPFDVSSAAPDSDFAGDGLVESVTNALARVRDIRVIARATAASHRGQSKDPRALGRALNVEAVVVGRLTRTGEQLRINAELVKTDSGAQLWGQSYAGSEADLLRFSDDMVRQISARLRGSDAKRATTESLPGTRDAEAFQLYLRGRHALARSTVPDIQKAMALFDEALALDPTYALCYSGIADSYLALSGAYLVPRNAMGKAKAAAVRAMSLDPELPEAHLSKGIVDAFYDFNWDASAQSIRRAISLQPTDASSHLWYAWNLMLTGHPDEAVAEAQAAHEIDPLSVFIEVGLGQMYYFAGRPEEAVRRLEDSVRTSPKFFNARYYLGVAYLHANRTADAIRELEAAVKLDAQQPQPVAYLVYAHAMNGAPAAARLRFDELTRLSESRYVSRYLFAVANVGLRRHEQAIQSLNQAYEDRDDMLAVLGVDKTLDSLQKDPRVATLLTLIGVATRR